MKISNVTQKEIEQGFSSDVKFQNLKNNSLFRDTWNTYHIFRKLWKDHFIIRETWSGPSFTIPYQPCVTKQVLFNQWTWPARKIYARNTKFFVDRTLSTFYTSALTVLPPFQFQCLSVLKVALDRANELKQKWSCIGRRFGIQLSTAPPNSKLIAAIYCVI